MGKYELLTQGLSTESHLNKIKEVFGGKNLRKVIFFTAFLTHNGIIHLKELIEHFPTDTTFIVGIGNNVTTYQGLTSILSFLKKVYVVDTGSQAIVFHPKLYYAEYENCIKLIVGSANMTTGGLNNNIEFSSIVEVSDTDSDFNEIKKKIYDSVTYLINLKNVQDITSQQQIETLFRANLLKDENKIDFNKNIYKQNNDIYTRPKLITLQNKKLRRANTFIQNTNPMNLHQNDTKNYTIVWQSKNLTERDLNIPKNTSTHATGSMNLDKGMLEDSIDHRHYFRDSVFAALDWKPTTKGTEEATATFSINIKGTHIGDYSLTISHTTSTDTASYKQRNAMTRLRWGDVKNHIAQEELIGCSLTLMIDEDNHQKFQIAIQ